MAKLLGNETSEATEVTREKEKPAACRFECTTEGTLEEIKLKFKPGSAAVHTLDLGIYTDSAGKTGTLLAHKTTTSDGTNNEQIVTAAGLSQVLTKGTFYHLAVVDKTAGAKLKYKKEAGKEEVTNEGVAWAELKEAGTWTNLAESTKMTIWGLGTESGEVLKPKAEIILSLKDVPTVVQKLNVTMTARFVLDDKFAPLQALAAALQTRLTLRESTAVLQTTKAALTSRMVLKEEISGTVSIKFITGFTVGLTLADKVSAQQLLKASPTARLVIGENITAVQAAKIAMTSQLNLRSIIAAKVKEGATGQRVTIFIFEE